MANPNMANSVFIYGSTAYLTPDTTATNTITNGNFIDVSGGFIIRRYNYTTPGMLSMLKFDASGNAFFNKTTDGSSDPTLTINHSNDKISFIPLDLQISAIFSNCPVDPPKPTKIIALVFLLIFLTTSSGSKQRY